MASRLFVAYSLLVAHGVMLGTAVHGPVVIWSNQKNPVPFDHHTLVIDMESLSDSITQFNGAAVVFIDSKLSSRRVSSAPYEGLKSLISTGAFHLSIPFSDHLVTMTQLATRKGLQLPSARHDDSIEHEQAVQFTLVDLSDEKQPFQAIQQYMDNLRERPYLVILSGPLAPQQRDDFSLVDPARASFVLEMWEKDFYFTTNQTNEHRSALLLPLRRLQSVTTTVTTAPTNTIDLRAQDLPATLFLVLFLIGTILGVSCLFKVDTPVSFIDKTLTVNKEY